jgi:hypothetical protein
MEPEINALLQAKNELSSRLLQNPARDGITFRSRSVEAAVAAAASGRNVHAVGIGAKIVDGQPTDTLCVRIYVTQKLAPTLLGDNTLPAEVGGVPTDVIESAPAFLLPAVTAVEEVAVTGEASVMAVPPPCSTARRRRQRPVRGGISAAHFLVTAGTISCFCRSTRQGDDPEQVFVLSNNHVFADVNQGQIGDFLLQQSPNDEGTSSDQFARLARFVPIQLGGTAPNRVDGALGAILPGIKVDPEICSLGRITGTEPAAENMRVRKHGRTTGFTEGVVTDISYDALVGMDHLNPAIVGLFIDQIRIERTAPHPAFGLGGDSGSLVVHADRPNAVGLYFAGPDSGFYGIANPIDAVLTELEIDLI